MIRWRYLLVLSSVLVFGACDQSGDCPVGQCPEDQVVSGVPEVPVESGEELEPARFEAPVPARPVVPVPPEMQPAGSPVDTTSNWSGFDPRDPQAPPPSEAMLGRHRPVGSRLGRQQAREKVRPVVEYGR